MMAAIAVGAQKRLGEAARRTVDLDGLTLSLEIAAHHYDALQ